MSKEKARSLTAAPELHFYASLQLEEAAHLIESIHEHRGIVAHRPDELLAKVTDAPPVSIGLDDADIDSRMTQQNDPR